MKSMMTGRLGAVEPQPGVRRKVGTATGFLAAVLLGVATIAAPNLAQAAGHGGGGGFHAGGGFHGGGFGGFHGGGFAGPHAGGAGGFHGGGSAGPHAGGSGGLHGGDLRAFRGGGFSGGGVHVDAAPGAGMGGVHDDRFRNGSAGGGVILRGGAREGEWHQGWHNGRYGWWWGYDPYLWSDDGLYDDQDSYGQASGYYCSDPAGYYPYVTQCNLPWQHVPAS
jgi:hypothetical protein